MKYCLNFSYSKNIFSDVLLKITKLDNSISEETLIQSAMEIFLKLSNFAYDIATAMLFFNIIDRLLLIHSNKETNKLLGNYLNKNKHKILF